jgi:hypothetical protein
MPYIDPTGENPGSSDMPQPGLGLTEYVDTVPGPAAPTLAEVKAAQVQKINDSATAVIDSAVAGYPEFERLTWSTQQAESMLWEAAAPEARVPELAPWCANAAANRKDSSGMPMPLDTFMALVAGNVSAFKGLSSEIAGKRQGYRDAIDAAVNTQSVEMIVWAKPLQSVTVTT